MTERKATQGAAEDGRAMEFAVAVARAWKLLIVVPIAMSILVAVAVQLSRSGQSSGTFRSQAIISAESLTESQVESPALLGRVLQAVGYSVQELQVNGAVADLASNLNVTALGNGLYQIDLKRKAPNSAQSTLKATLAEISSLLGERDMERANQAEQLIQALTAGLHRKQSVYDIGMLILSGSNIAGSSPDTNLGELWIGMVRLDNAIEASQRAIAEAQARVAGYKASQIIEQPSPDAELPQRQISSSRLGVLAGLVTGLVLLLLLFVRQQWQRLEQSPTGSAKLKRIIDAL